MNTEKGRHLDEDQIIMAVVDETDLDPQRQVHLFACPLCQAEKERLEKNLEWLGRKAERFTPLSRKRVPLPIEHQGGFRKWSRGWRPAFATAFCALVVASLLWSTMFKTTTEDRVEMLIQEMQEDERFMSEVDILIENAFSPVYLDISGAAEESPDDEFLQFIIPAIENQTDAHHLRKKGGKSLC
jgi:hypothetical protein